LPVDVFTVLPGSPAQKAGLTQGDRIVAIEGVQNPDWQEFLTQESIRANQNVSISVLRAGAVRNLTIIPEEKGRDHTGDVGLRPPFVVGSMEPGKPAQQAGLQVGDILVAANGAPIHGIDDMLAVLQEAKGAPVQVNVVRNGNLLGATLKPQLLDTPNHGKMYRVGIGQYRVEKLPFRDATLESLAYCRENSQLIFNLVGNMLDRLAHFHKAPIQQFSGPIGIMMLSGEALLINFWWYVEIVALISLNLAVFNLFPIPILDGGLMLMLLIEGIMRRDIKQEVKERVYQAAFVFLVVFAAVVIFNDVAKQFHF
jgi:regulator of sigma E protease